MGSRPSSRSTCAAVSSVQGTSTVPSGLPCSPCFSKRSITHSFHCWQQRCVRRAGQRGDRTVGQQRPQTGTCYMVQRDRPRLCQAHVASVLVHGDASLLVGLLPQMSSGVLAHHDLLPPGGVRRQQWRRLGEGALNELHDLQRLGVERAVELETAPRGRRLSGRLSLYALRYMYITVSLCRHGTAPAAPAAVASVL